MLTLKKLSYLFILLLIYSCVDPIPPDPVVTAGEMTGGEEVEDRTQEMLDSTFMIRILPVDSSLGAEIFCTGVALRPQLVITSASCFRAGVKYAEIMSGSAIDFQNNNDRLATVTKVYKHPAYSPEIPQNIGADLAIVHVDRQLIVPILKPFIGELNEVESTLYRVGYLADEEINFTKQVSFATGPTVNDALLSFSGGEGALEQPCLVSGGPVLAIVNQEPHLIAVSSWGDASCTEGGSASLLSKSVNFINNASSEMIELMDGEQAQVQGGLTCSQAFKCYQVPSCLLFLTEEAGMIFEQLYNCARDLGCTSEDCYQDSCPDLFNQCIGL